MQRVCVHLLDSNGIAFNTVAIFNAMASAIGIIREFLSLYFHRYSYDNITAIRFPSAAALLSISNHCRTAKASGCSFQNEICWGGEAGIDLLELS